MSGLPYSAFATEALPDEPLSSQAPPSEAPAESSQPEPSAGPDVAPQPDLEATPGPENSPEPDAAAEPSPVPPAEASPSPAPSAQPDSPYETELAQVDATQIWSSLQRARTRAAAGAGTAGVLQMGYSNAVLNKFSFANAIPGVNITSNGNSLTLSTTPA